jgi:hypothetical protein
MLALIAIKVRTTIDIAAGVNIIQTFEFTGVIIGHLRQVSCKSF